MTGRSGERAPLGMVPAAGIVAGSLSRDNPNSSEPAPAP